MSKAKKKKPAQYGKNYQWNYNKFRSILLGDKVAGIPGLRSIAYGFEKEDGYDLAKFDSWTPSKRAKLKKIFHRVELLQAQPKRIVRARGENLRKLQDSFHGEVPSKDFKVAFIPDTEPQLTLPGIKRSAPKIRVLKEGVSIQRKQYERVFIPFNQKNLVKNGRKEVSRVAAQMPDAKLYFVQVGEYQSLTGKSLNLITEQVLNWMQQYDGKKKLPDGSGNKGDDPKHHHWSKWLNGLVGYVLPTNVPIMKLARIISEGRRENEKLTRQRKNFMKRIRIKPRSK